MSSLLRCQVFFHFATRECHSPAVLPDFHNLHSVLCPLLHSGASLWWPALHPYKEKGLCAGFGHSEEGNGTDSSATRPAVRSNQQLPDLMTAVDREESNWGLGPLNTWETSQHGEGASGLTWQKTLLFPSRVPEFFLLENVLTTEVHDKS